MARKSGRRARRGTSQEREAVAAEYQEAIVRLQQTAFWNLRSTIASVCVFLGIFALLFLYWGEADGARLGPTLACAVGGVCGAGVYFSRPYPKLVRWLLIAAVTFTSLAIASLAIVAGVDT
ncbi:hypothetical protein AB0F81_37315 [Actinoplanes sp. NPDC024001]|uniref:hypothetical protein n=1 Tax=Actinoplanes sp. NPDC024001 TaxID=3154598 RepID=UPI0033E784A9